MSQSTGRLGVALALSLFVSRLSPAEDAPAGPEPTGAVLFRKACEKLKAASLDPERYLALGTEGNASLNRGFMNQSLPDYDRAAAALRDAGIDLSKAAVTEGLRTFTKAEIARKAQDLLRRIGDAGAKKLIRFGDKGEPEYDAYDARLQSALLAAENALRVELAWKGSVSLPPLPAATPPPADPKAELQEYAARLFALTLTDDQGNRLKERVSDALEKILVDDQWDRYHAAIQKEPAGAKGAEAAKQRLEFATGTPEVALKDDQRKALLEKLREAAKEILYEDQQAALQRPQPPAASPPSPPQKPATGGGGKRKKGGKGQKPPPAPPAPEKPAGE